MTPRIKIEQAPLGVQEFFHSHKVWDYDEMKSRLLPCLVNKKNNAELLSYATGVDFLDMAVIFRVVIKADVESDELVSFVVDDKALNEWGVTSEQVLADSIAAAEKNFPVEISRIDDILGLAGESETKPDLGNTFMVMSNDHRHYGAATMLYPGALGRVYFKLRQPFYIIPSSIHEVLIVPESLRVNATDCKDMCVDVNTSIVSESDILGDTIYHYGADGLRIVA